MTSRCHEDDTRRQGGKGGGVGKGDDTGVLPQEAGVLSPSAASVLARADASSLSHTDGRAAAGVLSIVSTSAAASAPTPASDAAPTSTSTSTSTVVVVRGRVLHKRKCSKRLTFIDLGELGVSPPTGISVCIKAVSAVAPDDPREDPAWGAIVAAHGVLVRRFKPGDIVDVAGVLEWNAATEVASLRVTGLTK